MIATSSGNGSRGTQVGKPAGKRLAREHIVDDEFRGRRRQQREQRGNREREQRERDRRPLPAQQTEEAANQVPR